MIQNEYLIQDLADKTGISLRTIRYYQQEGLLPEPENRGKFAYYNDDHLERLKLIQELKKNYLPLSEIAKQLNSLTYDQVKALVDEHQTGKAKQEPYHNQYKSKMVQPESENALQYVSRVLQTQTEIRDLKFEDSRAKLKKSSESMRYFSGSPSESWQRILLVPGIEIHVKEPLSPQDRKRLEDLIKFARNLFI